jgi:hypothetical protein
MAKTFPFLKRATGTGAVLARPRAPRVVMAPIYDFLGFDTL